MPSVKALMCVPLVMRSAAQPDIVDPRAAQLCPRLNVVELEKRASTTASPVLCYECASRIIAQIHGVPYRRGNTAAALTPRAPLRKARGDPRN